MLVSAVVFDIDDTLIATSATNARCRKSALESLYAFLPHVDFDDLVSAEDTLYRSFGWARLEDMWRALIAQFRGNSSLHTECPRLRCDFEENFMTSLSAFPTVEHTLKDLADREVPVGIISDGDRKWQLRKLEAVGLDRFFTNELILVSPQSDPYTSKPSTHNFRTMEKLMELRPEELVYVGDKHKDVLAANTSGWTSVRTVQAFDGKTIISGTEPLAIEKPDTTITTMVELLETVL